MSLVSESVVQKLRLPQQANTIKFIGALDGKLGTSQATAMMTLVPPTGAPPAAITITAHVVPRVSSYVPQWTSTTQRKDFAGLDFADPDPSTRCPIDLIVGADYFGSLLLPGMRRGTPSALNAQQTIFGRIASGPTGRAPAGGAVHHVTAQPVSVENDPRTRRRALRAAFGGHAFAAGGRSGHSPTPVKARTSARCRRVPVARDCPLALARPAPRDGREAGEVASRIPCRVRSARAYGGGRRSSEGRRVSTACIFTSSRRREANPRRGRQATRRFQRVEPDVERDLPQRSYAGRPKLQRDIMAALLRRRLPLFALKADLGRMNRQILVRPSDASLQCGPHRTNHCGRSPVSSYSHVPLRLLTRPRREQYLYHLAINVTRHFGPPCSVTACHGGRTPCLGVRQGRPGEPGRGGRNVAAEIRATADRRI